MAPDAHDHDPDDDFLDGCDVDFNEDPLPEEHQELYPLFAGVPDDEVEVHAAKLRELADAGMMGPA